MSNLRLSLSRLLLAPLFAALLLPACSANGASSSPPGGLFDGNEWRVTVRNQTDRYVWVSRYWQTTWTKDWHLENYSRCIGPHGESTASIDYTGPNGAEARLRAEVKPASATGCEPHENTADVWGNACNEHLFTNKEGTQQWHVVRAEAFIKYDGKDYTVPTSCDVAHWSLVRKKGLTVHR